MGKVKKIVNGVVVEVDESQIVKTIENGVVVERPLSQVKKKESIADIGSAGSSVSSKTSDSIKEISPGVSATGESAGVMPGVQHSLGEESYLEEGGGIGSALKLAGAPPKKYEAPSIEEFNKKFESFTGRKEIDLGSDLPQIKKQKEQKKYEQYRAEETVLNETIKKINSGDATMVDFVKVNKISPKVLNEVKNSVGISVLKDDIPEGENKEDSYLWRVYAGYKDKVFDQRLSDGRQIREELDDRIKENIPAVSRLTGYEYTVPTSLDDAKKILSDINAKKAEFAAFIEAATKNFINVAPEQTKAAIGAISEADKIMPSLVQSVKGFVFDEESKKNPSVTPFEVGKKVLEIINPDVYAIYMNVGGDKTYREGVYGQGISHTPKKADAVNRRILELGIDAFNTFGNKAAIAKADESSKSLRWKFTKPIEEETKHMIAASLMQSGVNPSKATDEQKDAIADTLPEMNREVWFNNNKTENNTQLPNTGFLYSFGNMYRHTVEDATKTLLGWMMPERTREQALDALEEQGMSKTIGENPESKARLDQLVRKEKAGPLTDEEMAEKEMLSKFTNTRNWWQKFKDLSGGTTGQFAGFGTISAFTGGMSNTKNTLGAVKSLIAPNAGKEGMLIAGYLMSREANAREAASLFPGKNEGIKRFVYGELASVIDTFVERIFPEEKFLNTSVVKKDLAKIIPGINANNIRQYLTEGFAEKFAKTAIKKIADWQKTPLQESFEEMLAAYTKDTINGIMDPGADAISMDELVNIGTQAYLGTQLLGVPKGVMAQRNKYVPINAIWDAASDKNTYFDVRYTIEEMRHRKELSDSEANEKISMLNTARKLWEDSPVLSGQIGNLSDRQRQNYLVRQLDELALKKKADETADENVKAEYNRLISESKEIRKKIFNDEMFVTDRNDEVEVKQMTPVQVIQQQAEKGLLAGGYSELIKENPALAEDVLLDYAKQKYGLTDKGQELDMGGRQIDNKEVDAAVTRAFPDKQSVLSYLAEKESVAKLNVRSREVGEAVMPILERVNNADYINEGELDAAANSLYELMDEVENSEMSDEQKQSSLNLIEPIITKLEGYEFRTKTESGETTEVKATVVPRQISKKPSAPALEQSAGAEVEITLPDGGKRKGRLGIKSGSYIVDVPKGQQIVLGEKAITDRDLSLPDEQEMENPIEFDDDGNVASITFKTKNGNLVKIKDSEVALDLAIQLKADMVGNVPQSEFDLVFEEVKKPYTKEVLVSENKDFSVSAPNQATKPIGEQSLKEQPKAEADSVGVARIGEKQFARAFQELNEAKTAEQKINAIAKIKLNENAGGLLTDVEKQQISEVENSLKEDGYEMPNLYGVKFNEGMRLTVESAIPDDTLADGETVITRVLVPQINKDGKMIQSAKVVVTVGTKEGGLTTKEWLAEKQIHKKQPQSLKEQPKAEADSVGVVENRKIGLLDYFRNIKKDSAFEELVSIGENMGIGVKEYDSDSPLAANFNGSDVTINKRFGKASTNSIAHEVIHGILHKLTSNKYKGSSLDVKLQKFKKELFDYIDSKGIDNLGLKPELKRLYLDYIRKSENTQEIVTFAFTNEQFHNFLSSIKSEGVINKSKTLWGKLKDIFKSTLQEVGIKSKLDELVDLLDSEVPLKTVEQSLSTPQEGKGDKGGGDVKKTIEGINNDLPDFNLEYKGTDGKTGDIKTTIKDKNGNTIGFIHLNNNDGKVKVRLAEIFDSGKGIGTNLYKQLNKALVKNGLGELHSDTEFLKDTSTEQWTLDGKVLTKEEKKAITDDVDKLIELDQSGRLGKTQAVQPAVKLWEKLVKEGVAEKTKDGYKFKAVEQSLSTLQEGKGEASTQTSTAQTKVPQPVQGGNEGASVQKSAKEIESLKAEKQSKIKEATRLSVAVEELDADSIPDDISSSVMSKESKKYERAKAEMKKLKELADCIWG